MMYIELVHRALQKLTASERNTLFYCSLFDPSSWEEMRGELDATSYESELDENVFQILRRVDAKLYRRITKTPEKRTGFLRGFVYNGDLCALMIAKALSEENVRTRSSKQALPDLISTVAGEEIGIEIKRFAVCREPKKRIEDEVLDKLERGLWRKPFILLLIFPELEIIKENPFRVQQFFDGYYFLEDLIAEKAKIRAHVLCQYITAKYSREYSFDKLIGNLAKNIKKWKID